MAVPGLKSWAILNRPSGTESMSFSDGLLLVRKEQDVYRVLFTIEGPTVNVLRVRQAAQDRLAPEDF